MEVVVERGQEWLRWVDGIFAGRRQSSALTTIWPIALVLMISCIRPVYPRTHVLKLVLYRRKGRAFIVYKPTYFIQEPVRSPV